MLAGLPVPDDTVEDIAEKRLVGAPSCLEVLRELAEVLVVITAAEE